MTRFRMPAEWEPHSRTLIGWPCREWSWGPTLGQGREEFARIANTIAAYEPVTMVCANEEHSRDARARLSETVDIVVRPMDGSWLRDNGPIFVTNGTELKARHFRFNAWGERHADRDRDARLGATLARDFGVESTPIDVVLEGGAVTVDGAGTMIAPERCVMHPTRNWYLSKEQVEADLSEALGLDRVIWIEEGLTEDQTRDPDRMYYGTDGHIDLFMCFIGFDRVLMLEVPEDNVNFQPLAASRAVLKSAGIEVVGFPHMSGFEADGRHFIAPYMNFYICNGAVIMPQAGADPEADEAARTELERHFPDRDVIGMLMRAAPMQGGAIHCLTQQVPAISAS
ncbi:MAG: agmatine deiminase family protein [Pseudomonadota bacterium]